ncbi:hypothetical protein [Nonomuraea rubra]|uniref:hypothetical protein n=1 Tax=Nonomuraea rubra TaxID=46180 RepID=UPI0033EAE913
MSLADLTFDQWRTIEPATAHRIAQEAADLVAGRVAGVGTIEHLGGTFHPETTSGRISHTCSAPAER